MEPVGLAALDPTRDWDWGTVRELAEPAIFAFEDTDGRRVLTIAIMAAATGVLGLPSLLGRDILNRWRMTYDPTVAELTFDSPLRRPYPRGARLMFPRRAFTSQ